MKESYHSPSRYFKWTERLRPGKKREKSSSPSEPSKISRNTIPNNLESSTSLEEGASTRCTCCGTLLRYPKDQVRIKCLNCNTYFTLNLDVPPFPTVAKSAIFDDPIPLAGYNTLKLAIQKDRDLLKQSLSSNVSPSVSSNSPISSSNSSHRASTHILYPNVEKLVEKSFGSLENLNSCFQLDTNRQVHPPSPNLNIRDIRKFYTLLLELPSKRPIFKLLTCSLYLLKHPPLNLEFHQLNWILILLENPLLYESITSNNRLSPHFNEISFEITRRLIGILSNVDESCYFCLIHWWSKLSQSDRRRKIEYVNLYLNFHITRLYTHCLNEKLGKSKITFKNTENNYNYKKLFDFKVSFDANVKLQIGFYSECWHLKTACRVMSFLFTANKRATHQLPDSTFYNTLVDFVNLYQDYDIWQFNNSYDKHEQHYDHCHNPNSNFRPMISDILLMDYNKSYLGISIQDGVYKRSQFTFCSYPFLISLGSKISILEHESKRVMGLKAEEAFISSIIEGKNSDIYFKLSIRRNDIIHDSLMQIRSHPTEVRKLLKVEFVNEPGIDAGGLKKEWFSLLTKELFDPLNGLISYSNENSVAYLTTHHNPRKIAYESYHLLGIVLGMAIYNSIILDIHFPPVIYKKLLGFESSFDDLKEIEPLLWKNLKSLINLKDAGTLGLSFEVTVEDVTGQLRNYELIKGGSNIKVTNDNRLEYILKYSKFLLDGIIDKQFGQFKRGFDHVMGTPSFTLFTPNEIQKLVAGDETFENDKYDVDILESICKLKNCKKSDNVVVWFWEYFRDLSVKKQRKLMRFVAGTDRIPATGLQSMQLKISKLYDTGRFSNRLPVSHTCFNELCLWNYESKEVLRDKLDMAISESVGFTLK